MAAPCRACGKIFSSTASFDKHRAGSYGDAIYDESGKKVIGYTPHTRHCLSEDEMIAKGMVIRAKKKPDEDDVWLSCAMNREYWTKKHEDNEE
jgi:hypothetical protein